ncbi:hypothetical protein FPRO05_09221 [Fusarium proliferatum]|uniref:DUF7703 domain-containing protein n=1 Tax=Gibberella intermedia TaxID=948311 RepID=A0A365NGJ3_GIBIN|nr:hypothetical protein FPRO05_09221 [Fusarium proliferatum]
MAAESGETGQTGPISVSLPVNMAIAGLFAIACYNCLEILISLLSRFKRHDGLYFWSMMIATLGILLHSIVVMLRYYGLGPNFLLCVLTCVGWYGMVTGQSVVLYSRLHLIVEDKSKTRWVLYMIIINFFILHVPTTVLFLGSNTKHSARYIGAFNVYERIQLAGFCIQETIISGLYIWETDCNCMHIVGEPETPPPDPSSVECQSIGRNSSTRTGSDVPIQTNVAPIQMNHFQKYNTNASSQSGGRHQKASPLNFLDYCE